MEFNYELRQVALGHEVFGLWFWSMDLNKDLDNDIKIWEKHFIHEDLTFIDGYWCELWYGPWCFTKGFKGSTTSLKTWSGNIVHSMCRFWIWMDDFILEVLGLDLDNDKNFGRIRPECPSGA